MKACMITFGSIVVSLALACQLGSDLKPVAARTTRPETANSNLDSTQSELVLNLLRSSVEGKIDPIIVDSVLNAHGTTLIIKQQNISRTVTTEQYRALLLALNHEQMPDITAADKNEKGRRGLEGLRKDVWPSLRWGRANISVLASRIQIIKGLELFRTSTALALRFLPGPVDLSPTLYVVMGGRAGAAALEGDEIYFDVLATSYRAAIRGVQYPDASQIVEYFAHEIHHIGLSQLLNRTRRTVRLTTQEERAFAFLTAIIMEGSASYLINGHRSLEAMRRDPEYSQKLSEGCELLKHVEEVLRSVLDRSLSDEAYDQLTTPFLGSGWHSTGAIMLAAIDQAHGLRALMKVLLDPRQLLIAYNVAVTKLGQKCECQRIDPVLAKRISGMGRSSHSPRARRR